LLGQGRHHRKNGGAHMGQARLNGAIEAGHAGKDSG